MTKLALPPLIAALLALSACGSSQSAREEAQPDNVEMPAEEAIGDIDATPVADTAPAAEKAAPEKAAPEKVKPDKVEAGRAEPGKAEPGK